MPCQEYVLHLSLFTSPLHETHYLCAFQNIPPTSQASLLRHPTIPLHTLFNKMLPFFILTSSLYHFQPRHSPIPLSLFNFHFFHSCQSSSLIYRLTLCTILHPTPSLHLRNCNLSPHFPTPTLCSLSLLSKHHLFCHMLALLSIPDCPSHFHCLPNGSCSTPRTGITSLDPFISPLL